MTELKGHTDTVYSMRFSRDGNMLASGRYDHALSRAYHLRNKKKNLAELTFAMTSRTVTRDKKFGSRYPLVSKVANSLFFIHSSIHLFSGGVDSCVKLWNAHAICNPDDDDDEASREK